MRPKAGGFVCAGSSSGEPRRLQAWLVWTRSGSLGSSIQGAELWSYLCLLRRRPSGLWLPDRQLLYLQLPARWSEIA